MEVKLVTFKTNGQRKDFGLRGAVTVIGRGEKCELRVPVSSVSRRHCEFTISDDELKVKDLASSNGTYVNNKRVNESLLIAGDRIVVGPVVFTVQINGKPEEIQPAKAQDKIMAQATGQVGKSKIEEIEAEVLAGDESEAGIEVEEDEAPEDPISALEALASESIKKKKK